MNSIDIVQASLSDYDSFLTCFAEIEELHRLHAPRKFRKPEPVVFAYEFYESLLRDEQTDFWVAKDGDMVVGFVITYLKDAPDVPVLQPRTYVEIDNLAVHSHYKRQ